MAKKQEAEVPVLEGAGENHTLQFHSYHPKANPDRVSYTIPGRSGNLVIFLSLFADGVAPQTLTLDALLAPAAVKVDKTAIAAEKAAAKIIKEQERIAKAQARADAIKQKAADALAAAQKRAEEATAKLAAAQSTT